MAKQWRANDIIGTEDAQRWENKAEQKHSHKISDIEDMTELLTTVFDRFSQTATREHTGLVKPDGSTISIDRNGVLSVNTNGLNINSVDVSNKIINQNGNQQMKYWYGSQAQYNAVSKKDPQTIYDVFD